MDGSFFPVLGVQPAIGRMIGSEDDHTGDPSAVAVVSWSFWKSRFNLDPAILGKKIIVEDVPVTVVGVASRSILRTAGGVIARIVWLPLALQLNIARSGLRSDLGWGSLWLVGRLKPGVSISQAQAEMAVLYESTLDEQAKATNNPFIRKMKLEMEPAGAGLSHLREEWAKPLLLLQAVVGFLLLLACTNLARHAAGTRGGAPARNGVAPLTGSRSLSPGAPGPDRVLAPFRGSVVSSVSTWRISGPEC